MQLIYNSPFNDINIVFNEYRDTLDFIDSDYQVIKSINTLMYEPTKLEIINEYKDLIIQEYGHIYSKEIEYMKNLLNVEYEENELN